jgi:hypothetical protein
LIMVLNLPGEVEAEPITKWLLKLAGHLWYPQISLGYKCF